MESILLSLSQKELEFYNVNHVNDEIIKKREQLIENIKADKAKYETIIYATKTSNITKLKKSRQEVAEQETVDLDEFKLEINKLKEAIEQDRTELDKFKNEVIRLKTSKLEEIKLKEAELNKAYSDKTKLSKIKLDTTELKKIEPKIAKLKADNSKKIELKTAELEKVKQDIDELKKIESNTMELEKTIEQNIVELNKIKQEIAKLKVNKLKANKLRVVKEKIIELEKSEEEKQSLYSLKFTQCFAKIFNIKTPNIIEGVKSYCEGQIKIADNKINHAENTNILYEQLRPLHRQRRAERSTIERYKLARQNQQRLKENSIYHYNEAIIHRGNNSGRSI